jgi:hypothetical protein
MGGRHRAGRRRPPGRHRGDARAAAGRAAHLVRHRLGRDHGGLRARHRAAFAARRKPGVALHRDFLAEPS